MTTKSPTADGVARTLATTALEIAVARAAVCRGEPVKFELLARSVEAVRETAHACGTRSSERFDERLRSLEAELDALAADLTEIGAEQEPPAARLRTGTGS
jgi:hypothetical protein